MLRMGRERLRGGILFELAQDMGRPGEADGAEPDRDGLGCYLRWWP
jgi:hypothetical protein